MSSHAGALTNVRQPPHSPTEQDDASLAQKRAAAAGAHGLKKHKTKLAFDSFSIDLVGNATGSMQEGGLSGSVQGRTGRPRRSEPGRQPR